MQDETEAVNGDFSIAQLLEVQFTSQVIQQMNLQSEDIFNLTEVVEDVYENIQKPRGIPDYAPLLTLGVNMSELLTAGTTTWTRRWRWRCGFSSSSRHDEPVPFLLFVL